MYSSRVYNFFCRDMARYGGLSRWLLFRCLPTLILTAISMMILASTSVRAENEPGDVGSGQMSFRAEGEDYQPALTQSTKVRFSVSGMLATVTVEQEFLNAGSQWVEGVYVFPLPEEAAVRSMEMRVGERRIVGTVRERVEAKRIYKKALAAGKKASLIEQQRPNLFTNRVANIGPGESISVSLEYVQSVEYRQGSFSLRLPTTITPRYMPGQVGSEEHRVESLMDETLTIMPDHGWAMPTDEVSDGHLISPLLFSAQGSDATPLNRIEISARLDMGMPLASVDSPYHEIALSRRAGVYDIKLAQGHAEMNRDFVLRWTPVSGGSPGAAFFTEKVEGEYFGLLMLVPPAVERTPEPAAREIVFVVDTSGSMGGVSISQARNSLDRALRHLRPQDQFNIIEFNSDWRALFRQAVAANRHNVQLAAEYVRHLDASGGTEMMPALRAALSPPGPQDEMRAEAALRQVVFITDGAVGNESALYEEIVRNLGPSRLFTVGIGSAPNSWFMRKAAEYGRGTFTYIGDVREVGQKMDALFEQLSNPMATHLSVDWPAGAEVWPARVPDLYQGEPLLVAVKFGEHMSGHALKIQGRSGNREWVRELQLPGALDPQTLKSSDGVASFWARKKIAGLLDEKHRGKADPWVRERVLPLALKHSLMSPYTSFVAVEEVVARPPGKGVKSGPLPNTRPQGQTPQPFAYPNTATTAAANIWLGGFLLLVALFFRATRMDHTDA